MTDPASPASHDDPGGTKPGEAEPGPLQIALGFFILPLLLVLGGVAVFLLFGVLAHERTDPAEYLQQINGRGINEPWQAAFHLSQQLEYDDDLKGDGAFAQQVVDALDKAGEGDPRVRRFLTVALGRIGHPAAVPALVGHTRDPDPEVRLNSLWALGIIGDAGAADEVAACLDDRDPEVRTMAAYVLGVLKDRSTTPALETALNDPSQNVRWNAAVALGLMGDAAALNPLRRMIDRHQLASVEGITPQQLSQTMLAALAALRTLAPAGLESQLIQLRDNDPDLRVREAARDALTVLADSASSSNAGPRLAQER